MNTELSMARQQYEAARMRQLATFLHAQETGLALRERRREIAEAVNAATDGSGKPLYSSEDKRKAEIERRLSLLPEYTANQEAIRDRLVATAELSCARERLTEAKVQALLSMPHELLAVAGLVSTEG
jgi:hypothetical protein